jgi:hypothetical protein
MGAPATLRSSTQCVALHTEGIVTDVVTGLPDDSRVASSMRAPATRCREIANSVVARPS